MCGTLAFLRHLDATGGGNYQYGAKIRILELRIFRAIWELLTFPQPVMSRRGRTLAFADA